MSNLFANHSDTCYCRRSHAEWILVLVGLWIGRLARKIDSNLAMSMFHGEPTLKCQRASTTGMDGLPNTGKRFLDY